MREKFIPFASDCLVNDKFVDANSPGKVREEYCRKFCCYRCLRRQEYKKRNSEKRGSNETI